MQSITHIYEIDRVNFHFMLTLKIHKASGFLDHDIKAITSLWLLLFVWIHYDESKWGSIELFFIEKDKEIQILCRALNSSSKHKRK